MAKLMATKPIPSFPMAQLSKEAPAMKAMKSTSITAPNQKNPTLSMPSFSSKVATRSAASAFSSDASRSIPNRLAPSQMVMTVTTST